ncbi:MAG: 6,7-dimethyl-8-ribityllumazine synthase [Methylobacteriaceae bacterium]|nr:6,7-dimethyl-8-ribityllumazine synthase [Methylobacteriaceae bacterium]
MVTTHPAPKRAFPPVPGTRVLIVETRYYPDIAEELLTGVLQLAEEVQAETEILTVDGSLEIPATVAIALDAAERQGKPYDAVVALGCVIRGETSHYDVVAGESARALMDISVSRQIPVGNAIITTENMEQALERARVSQMNKGRGALEAALVVLNIKRRLANQTT